MLRLPGGVVAMTQGGDASKCLHQKIHWRRIGWMTYPSTRVSLEERIAMRARGIGMTLMVLSVLLVSTMSSTVQSQDADAARELQQLQQQAHASLERQMRDEGFVPTRVTALDQSLEQLLNGGYSIVSTEQTSTGHALTLRDQSGQKWVLCILASRPSADALRPSFESLCRALN